LLVVQQPPLHPAQAAPPAPQEEIPCPEYASHEPVTPPLQQPSGHVLPSQEHVPFVLSHKLLPHAAHPAPPVPHSEPDCDAYVTHVAPLQQPAEQEEELHTHAPVVVLHACPDAQDAHAAPPSPHWVNDSDA
jgi:hypothetical protein